MAAINRMDVQLITSNRLGASGVGAVYVGMCGREFAVNRDDLDFTAGSQATYVFGQNADIFGAEFNDPRSPVQLDTDNVNVFPRYVRFEPTGPDDPGWDLESVMITLNPGPGQVALPDVLSGANHIWLGGQGGRILFLPAL